MNLFKLVSFIINPQKAIDYANKFRSDPYTIGYLNEFFAKYISFGKSNEEILKINEAIDQDRKTDNKLIETLKELRKIRLEIKRVLPKNKDQIIKTTKNFGISKGKVTGIILNIKNTKQKIPKKCIGIFPTAGAKFDTQFLKCVGIIFKNGGITSHGAILAREFSIPALVSPNVKIADGEKVTIDGNMGSVKIVDINN